MRESVTSVRNAPTFNRHTNAHTRPFDEIKRQLSQLTPNQLKTLRGEINHQLAKDNDELLSSAEREMLTQLFS